MDPSKLSAMHILFLVPRLDKASTRYRVSQFLPALEEAGITWEIRAVSRTSRGWPQFLRQLVRADVVFIQKKLFTFLEIAFLRKLCRRLVYDFDDAVMFKDGPASSRQQHRQSRRFAATARRADLVIAGNRYLAAQTRTLQRRVVEIPTALDLNRYKKKPLADSKRNEVVLGWIGSRGTIGYLREITPVLEELGRRRPGFRLKIVADEFFDLQHLPVDKKLWSAEDEIADLHSFDIGLMPLNDDKWTRGKCGFKLLQCMAVGVPVVCSPVGANCDIVTDGAEGFHVRSPEEWIHRLEQLADDPQLRTDMGRRGRAKVEKQYSLKYNVSLLIRLLQVVHQGDSLPNEERSKP